jgi:hypothetical protein
MTRRRVLGSVDVLYIAVWIYHDVKMVKITEVSEEIIASLSRHKPLNYMHFKECLRPLLQGRNENLFVI